MSALRQPDFPPEYYAPKAPGKKVRYQPQIAEQTRLSSATVVRSKAFSTPGTLPKNLRTLSLLQKGSFGLAIASMTTSVGLYISTVNIPKLWSQEYQHLEDLQRQERQLVAINETIKYQIAQEAVQDASLAISKPESALFISPAQVKVKHQSDLKKDRSSIIGLKYNSLGY